MLPSLIIKLKPQDRYICKSQCIYAILVLNFVCTGFISAVQELQLQASLRQSHRKIVWDFMVILYLHCYLHLILVWLNGEFEVDNVRRLLWFLHLLFHLYFSEFLDKEYEP